MGTRKLGKNRVARSIKVDAPIAHNHQPVGHGQHAGPMRDDHDRDAPRLLRLECVHQTGFPVAIEVGVWLIKHKQFGFAIECAR